MIAIDQGHVPGTSEEHTVTHRIVCRRQVSASKGHSHRAGWPLRPHRSLQPLRTLRSRNSLSTRLSCYALQTLRTLFSRRAY